MNDPYKKVSPSALIALKEALAAIYWYKKDLRSFITYTIKNSAIVSTIDWQNLVKYHAVSELVDRMAARPDLYHDDLLSLFREVANLTDFSHLKRCEDPEQKICTAQEKVRALQAHVRGHLDLLKEKEKAAQRRQEAQQKPVDAGDLYKIAGVLSGKLKIPWACIFLSTDFLPSVRRPKRRP